MTMRTTADDPRRYRSDEELEAWKAQDPITRFEIYLQRKNVLTKKKIEAVDEEVLAQIQAAVDRAERQMKTLGDPLDMFDHAYADLPPHVAAQRDEMAAEPAAAAREGRDLTIVA